MVCYHLGMLVHCGEEKKGVIKSEDYGRELSGGVPPTDEPTSSFVFDPIFLRNGPHNFLLM